MYSKKHLATMIVGILSALVLGVGSLAASPEAGGEDCASIQAWVEANAADLPTTYADLSRFSVAYRRAIFDAAPAAVKSSLWREHFQAYLDSHRGLTAAQVEVVEDMKAMASPALFARHQGSAAQDARSIELRAQDTLRLSELETRAAALFPEHELARLMGSLGPIEESAPSTQGVVCECSDRSDYCPTGYLCDSGADCDFQSGGCGTFWLYSCDGLCKRD